MEMKQRQSQSVVVTTTRSWRHSKAVGMSAVVLALLMSQSDPMIATAFVTTKSRASTSKMIPPRSVKSVAMVPLSNSALPAVKGSSSPSKKCSELEFELQVGKALDVLKKDYADLLIKPPNYEIYASDMELVDPSGVTVHGLGNYQNAFRLLHALIKFLYCPEKSAMTSVRMYYCPVKRNIRIHWNAQVVPREIFRGSRSILYVDGISVYEFDRATGNIVQHKFEQLIMNNGNVRPKEGVVAALSYYHGLTVPSFFQNDQYITEQQDLFHLPFQYNYNNKQSLFSPTSTSFSPLYSMEASRSGSDGQAENDASHSSAVASNNNNNNHQMMIDWDSLESKNRSRKKFGLPPLTPEDFLRLESHIKAMDAEQQVKRRQQQQAAAAAAAAKEEQKKQNTIWDKLLGSVKVDVCESNFDCERPKVCCDFGFQKICCASGSPVLGQQQQQPALVPVPVETQDYPPLRPQRQRY